MVNCGLLVGYNKKCLLEFNIEGGRVVEGDSRSEPSLMSEEMERLKADDRYRKDSAGDGDSEDDRKPSPFTRKNISPLLDDIHSSGDSASEVDGNESSTAQASSEGAKASEETSTGASNAQLAINQSHSQSEIDDVILAKKRQMNIIYSRRKRAKKKRLVEGLKANKEDFERKNSHLRMENERLEQLLMVARAQVAQIETAAFQQLRLQSQLTLPSSLGASPALALPSSPNLFLQGFSSGTGELPATSAVGSVDSLAILSELNRLNQPPTSSLGLNHPASTSLHSARALAGNTLDQPSLSELVTLQEQQRLVQSLQRDAIVRRQQELLASMQMNDSPNLAAQAPGGISSRALLSRLLDPSQESLSSSLRKRDDMGKHES